MPMAMEQARWPGWSAERTLVLPVPEAAWAPPRGGVTLDGVAFEPKRELHVTLASGALGRELHVAMRGRALERATRAAFEAQDWSFTRAGRWLLLRKPAGDARRPGAVHSIIECIDMPALAPFHATLGNLLGRELALPPPHVTLFTARKAEGLGVASARQLRAYLLREVAADELTSMEVAGSPPPRA
ncbi:MAG: hypothetical protein EOP92_24910 [Lysobacteraceae bacterium]|nr:MAG: hypothetical protein EOP92_24910 [Xanthomonadaceae bacterium]